jgi:pimeloyl-ACP methyl ester carboxylesterase
MVGGLPGTRAVEQRSLETSSGSLGHVGPRRAERHGTPRQHGLSAPRVGSRGKPGPKGRRVQTRSLIGPLVVTAAGVAFLAGLERHVLRALASTSDPDVDRDFLFPCERVIVVNTPDGGELNGEECGSGPPVVLLHGHGASLRTFALMAAPLAASGRRVVAVDQRGFGRSSPVPPEFGFGGLVDDAAAVLEALDLRDAVVVGHSLGGAVALGLAIHRPDVVDARVSALVLINSSARGPTDRWLTRARVAALDWGFVEGFTRHPRHGVALARANFGVDAFRSHVEAARAIGHESPVDRRRGFTRRLLGIDLADALPTIRVPMLVIAGSADRVVRPSASERSAQAIPDAQFELFVGAGHMLPMERSAEVADLIVRFADTVEGRAREVRVDRRRASGYRTTGLTGA